MADPFSIATGVISLYSVLYSAREFKKSFAEAPHVLSQIEDSCDLALTTIRNASGALDHLRLFSADDVIGGVNIREELEKFIENLTPDILQLACKLKELRDAAGAAKHKAAKIGRRFQNFRRLPELEQAHGKILAKLKSFDSLNIALTR
jgi:hypothetical protein